MFTSKYKITPEHQNKVFKASMLKQLRLPLILSVLWVVLGLVFLTLYFTIKFDVLTSAILLLCLGVLQTPITCLTGFISFKATQKQQAELVKNMEIVVSFNESGITETDYVDDKKFAESNINYENVCALHKSGGMLLIYYTKINCIVIPEYSFISGDESKFEEFLVSKTNLKIK